MHSSSKIKWVMNGDDLAFDSCSEQVSSYQSILFIRVFTKHFTKW